MAYLEELLPEFRKGAKIRRKDWTDGDYLVFNTKDELIIDQEDCYRYMNVHAVYVKKAPMFDKVQPTWGMIVSAYRNGFKQGCKSTPIERYKEGIISFEELKKDE